MRIQHLLVSGTLLIVGVVLGWVYWETVVSAPQARLAELALVRVPDSGVSNPVTSVLLNFRAYDTLLELAVLMAAILGIWSIGPAAPGFLTAGEVLERLTAQIVPLLIVTAGYSLWVGAHAPGGAFQAGALLGAAGVMLRLAGRADAGLPRLGLLRLIIGLGVAAFVVTGLLLMGAGYGFLTFPLSMAKWLILAIETAAMLAIGATLAAAYVGGEPARR